MGPTGRKIFVHELLDEPVVERTRLLEDLHTPHGAWAGLGERRQREGGEPSTDARGEDGNGEEPDHVNSND